MRKTTTILIAILIGCSINCFAQGKVTRQKKEKTETQQTVSTRKQEEAQRKQKEEWLWQEEEARRKQEEERIKPKTGVINGHEWVDLGLPSGLKWAICNVGATSPEEYGDYFAWGETSTKSSYNKDNSLTYDKSNSTLESEGIIDSRGILNKRYDVANTKWGATWRMPTKNEIDELVKNCKREWTTQGGKTGCKVTGTNGNSIFVPAAGSFTADVFDGVSLYGAGKSGYFWSSSVESSVNKYAEGFRFSPNYQHELFWFTRESGISVRPVSE